VHVKDGDFPAPWAGERRAHLRPASAGVIGNYMVTKQARTPSGRTRTADEDLDRVFRALADPTRRAILDRLARTDATVNALAEPFAMSRPAISKHLNVLAAAGLVERTPDGRMTRCRLDAAGLATASEWLDRYRRYWEESLGRLADLLENEQSRPE
jgi:DNA-binding transcriptional ArsR family regulator